MTAERRERLTFGAILRSAGLYPVTTMYFAGVAVILVAVTGLASVPVCFAMFGVVAVFSVSWAALKELHAVHEVVDAQRADLIVRIDDLVGLLDEHGVKVPPPRRNETHARTDDEQRKAGV